MTTTEWYFYLTRNTNRNKLRIKRIKKKYSILKKKIPTQFKYF